MFKQFRPLLLLAVFMALSCTGCGHKENVSECQTDCDKEEIVRLEMQDDLGWPVMSFYEGLIAGYVNCSLLIYRYKSSGDGVFIVSMLDEEKELSVYKGRRYTLRGSHDEVIWECRADDRKTTIYFLCGKEGSSHIYWITDEKDTVPVYKLERVFERDVF